jgi:hypothetical protein
VSESTIEATAEVGLGALHLEGQGKFCDIGTGTSHYDRSMTRSIHKCSVNKPVQGCFKDGNRKLRK